MQELFHLTRDVALELKKGGLWQGDAPSGDAGETNMTDSAIRLTNDSINGGTIWFDTDRDTGYVYHALRRITNIGTSGNLTYVAYSPLSGDPNNKPSYTIFGPVYPMWALKAAVNVALQNIGEFQSYAYFSSVALQEDYNLAVVAPQARQISTVEVSTYSDPSTADNPGWGSHYGTIQFGDTLRFLTDPPVYDGVNNIRLGYNAPHPALVADRDEIRREVSPIRLKWEAVAEAYIGRIALRDSQVLDEQTQNLYNRAMLAAGKYPSHRNEPLPQSHLFAGVGSRGGAAVNPDLQV